MSTSAPVRPAASAEEPPRRPNLWRRFWSNNLHFAPGDPNRRMKSLAFAMVLLMAVFAGRLMWVQAIDSSSMATRAEKGRLATDTLHAPRGTIYDVRGVPLAQSIDARDIVVDQTIVEDPSADAQALAGVLGLPAADIQASLTGDKRFAYIAKGVTPAVAAQVTALQIAGVATDSTLARDYPSGALGANVVGFVGAEDKGLAGLELAYDEELSGTDGSRSVELVNGKLIPTGTDEEVSATPGASLRLTIDRDLQWAAQSAIAKQVAIAGAESGTVVLMEAKTGRILAMASVPTIDPAAPGETRAEDRENRAVVEAFEPGSTSKVMTMAAVIDEGKATPATEFTVPDTIERGGSSFSDHEEHETWQLTLAGVLAKSSNTGTIQAAELIGPDTLYSYLKKFGVGESTGLGFPGEATGYVPEVDDWSDTSFPTIAFGQGLSMSALQTASVYQTLANGGERVEPSLVETVINPDGSEQRPPEPTSEQVVKPETAAQVLAMMEEVVTKDGTAPQAAIPGYRIAGKTGTANRIDDSCGCYRGYTASFVGVAPADDPVLVAAVILQDPVNGHFGSEHGAPVFKDVMTAALQTLRVPPSGNESQALPVFADSER